MTVAGWPRAFRGSSAVAAGFVTWARLKGPAYARLFPDTYVRAADEPPSLLLRSLAAYRYVEGRGVLSGYSAAEVLRASCGPIGAPAEVTVPGGGQRAHPGLLVHRDTLAPGAIRTVGDVRTTSAPRTAFDLARWCLGRGELTEAVVAVDALARRGRFAPDRLLHLAAHYPRARGAAGLAEALAFADARAGSPMETRLRMLLVHDTGLPSPEVQYPVQDPARRRAVWLDLAYPEHLIGIEYEGADHTDPDRVLRDVGRYTRLVAAGWRIYRYTKFEIYRERDRIVAEITRALGRVR
ncbi:endonuclease domain-containing protein [Pseudonocardia sichuanensis]